MNHNRLVKLRQAAARRQNGRCWYCGVEMEPAGNSGSLLRRCTAEHLVPRSAGGGETTDNIVAACWFCNTRRHRRRNPLDPQAHRALVQMRLEAGK